MRIIEALESLGLNEKQARVYVTLLQLGQTSAYAVSEHSGLKRPTTYVILGELMQKGLALKVPRVRKRMFTAKSPEEFLGEAEEKLRLAKSVLPQLLAMTSGEKKPKALYFEGLRGARELLHYGLDTLSRGEIVGFYAHAEDASSELIQIFDDYNDKLKKKGIRVRGIAPEHSNLERWRKTDAEYGRQTKTIPLETYSANISLDMTDTAVRILDFKNLQGVVIENPDITNSVRQIFEMVWESRPEPITGRVGNTKS